MKRFNCLTLLALPAPLGLLAFAEGDWGLLGFFGFAVYIRYWGVAPDELFMQNVHRASTAAFITCMASLLPLCLACYFAVSRESFLRYGFGLAIALGIIVFTVYHTVLELREATC